MTFTLAVSQAPHSSWFNGQAAADARQYFLRPTQWTPPGPQIDTVIAGMVPNEVRQIRDGTGGAMYSRDPTDGVVYELTDWAPHCAYDPASQQIIHGGMRKINKISIYSDITGEWREEAMPRAMAQYQNYGHWYGRTAFNGTYAWLAGNLYDPATGEWVGTTPGMPGYNTSYAWFPDVGAQGAWVSGGTDLWKFDVNTQTASVLAAGINHTGGHEVSQYHPVHGKLMVAGGSDFPYQVTIVSADGSFVRAADAPAYVHMAGVGDGTASDAMLIAHQAGCWILVSARPLPRRVYAYWPDQDLWQEIAEFPSSPVTKYPSASALDQVRGVVYLTARAGLFAWKMPEVTAPSTTVALSGAAISISSASGAITTGIPLAGSAASVSIASGNLETSITLSGAALAQATASAAMVAGSSELAGVASGSASASGALSTGISMAGNAAALAAAIGVLTAEIRLSGSALSAAVGTGALSTLPSGLSGAAAASASASGALGTSIALVGEATATATADGALGVPILLSGAAAAVSSATGDLTLNIQIEGHSLAQALASGSLTTSITLDGDAVAAAVAAGMLDGTVRDVPSFRIHAPDFRSRIFAPIRRAA